MMENNEVKAFMLAHNLVVISDRSKGLIGAVKNNLPNAKHRYCALHILGNIRKGNPLTKADITLYWKVVYAASASEFQTAMLTLKEAHVHAYEVLTKIDPALWANYAFGIVGGKVVASSYGQVCSNMGERGVKYVGSDRDGGRKLSIIDMLSHIFSKVSISL
jgi:hypothetical protein